MTFNHVVIDFSGGGAFACGQTYVALSRCRSLEGIVLKSPIGHSDIFVRPEVVAFSRLYNNRQLIEKSLKEASADRLYRQSIRAFDKGDMELCLQSFFEAIHARYDIEKPHIRRYIRRKLNRYNIQQLEIKKLRTQLQEKTDSLKTYAYEYYLLGNECITKAHDTRAALANFDKALALDPTFVDAWVRKGVTLHDSGDLHGSARCYNEAIRLNPLSFKALYNRGKLRMDNESYEEAASDLLKAAEQKPKNATVHDRIADVFEHLGREDLADKYRQKAIKLRTQRKKET